jgi:hypothetical protein
MNVHSGGESPDVREKMAGIRRQPALNRPAHPVVGIFKDIARRSRNQRSADSLVRGLLASGSGLADKAVRAPRKSSPPAKMFGDSTARILKTDPLDEWPNRLGSSHCQKFSFVFHGISLASLLLCAFALNSD